MRPLRIAVLNLGTEHWLGGRYYLENVVRVLAGLPGHGTAFTVAYVVPAADADVHAGIGRLAEVVEAPELLAPRGGLARARRAADRLRGVRNPAVHRLLAARRFDFAFPAATGGERRGGYRTAHWIADLQYRHFPELQRPETLRAQERYLSDIAAHAERIVVSSAFGAADCAAAFGTPAERLVVLPFRVAPPDGLFAADIGATLRRYHLPDRFLLVSNQFWGNKNHLVVFEAIARLRAAGAAPTVVFTGHVYDPRQPRYSDTVHARIHELGIAAETVLLGAIPRTDQLALLRRAVAVVQPSRFEGWNTSIEEARAVGRPVIASDIPVHREQAFPGMTLFGADDADALAALIDAQWATGAPGGDGDAERVALARYAALVEAYGHRILALARGE